MYSVIRVLVLSPGTAAEAVTDRVREAATAAAPQQHVVGPTLPGNINGGDVLVRLSYTDREAWLARRDEFDAALAALPTDRIDGVEYPPTNTGVRDGYAGGGEIYRALMVKASGPAEQMDRFTADTLSMPDHISAMRAWALSPVDRAVGPTPWTHVWEQEYQNLDGLLGPYMQHPVHWAMVDRWFDPEFPDLVVGRPLCHTYCETAGTSVLA